MSFKEWLNSIDASRTWDTTKGLEHLEIQVLAAIREGNSINIREIFSQFCANEDPGFDDEREHLAGSNKKNFNLN